LAFNISIVAERVWTGTPIRAAEKDTTRFAQNASP